MSLYIPGLSLPKDEKAIHLEIHDDGFVSQWQFGTDDEISSKAIEVPPHGRLVDADAFIDDCPELMAYEMLMPTIIPRDGNAM